MRSTVPGRGQLFWQERGTEPAWHRDRSVLFDVASDGAAHDYRLSFDTKRALLALRLDPAQGPGEIRIESFPGIVFEGTVTSVSQLADSTRPWMNGGVKQYPTVVKLDDLKSQEV